MALAKICYGLTKEEFLDADKHEMEAYKKVYELVRERDETNYAKICWILAEINRNDKKKPRPYSIDDFMPKKVETSKQLSKKEFENKVTRFRVALEQMRSYQ